jgi:hypothetical protein
MSLQEEQAKRMEKIRALLAKAEDEATTGPEAEAFSAKAAELMERYSIDQAMIDAAAKIADPGKASGKPGKRRIISFAGQDFTGHKQDLLHAVAEHNGCSTVVTSTTGPEPRSYVFGYDSDLDLTEMLFTSLVLQAAHALLAEDIPFGDTPRSFNSAWWAGYARKIAWRLYNSREAAERNAERATPGTALVLKDRKAEVAKAVKEEFPETRKVSRGSGGKSRAGRAAGYAAGSRATLGTPAGISGGSASRAIER